MTDSDGWTEFAAYRKSLRWAALVIGMIFLAETAAPGQVHVNDLSLAEISAGAPTIVVAKLIESEPQIVLLQDTVTDLNGKQISVSFEIEVWTFEITGGIKHMYQSALPERIGVVKAYAEANYEIYLDSMKGNSTSYARERYAADTELTLESVGTEPVILFLSGRSSMADTPNAVADAFTLYVTNSLEHFDRFDEIAEFAKQPYRPGHGPSPPVRDD